VRRLIILGLKKKIEEILGKWNMKKDKKFSGRSACTGARKNNCSEN